MKSLATEIIISLTLVALISLSCSAAPFNLEIDLPSTYKSVSPGADIWFTLNILNLANTDRVDVTLKYDLVDEYNNVLVTKSKTVAVETQASFVADLKVPENAKLGNYYLKVNMNSPQGEINASTSLKVVTSKSSLTIYYIIGAIVLLCLIIILMIRSRSLIEKIKLKFKIRRIIDKRQK